MAERISNLNLNIVADSTLDVDYNDSDKRRKGYKCIRYIVDKELNNIDGVYETESYVQEASHGINKICDMIKNIEYTVDVDVATIATMICVLSVKRHIPRKKTCFDWVMFFSLVFLKHLTTVPRAALQDTVSLPLREIFANEKIIKLAYDEWLPLFSLCFTHLRPPKYVHGKLKFICCYLRNIDVFRHARMIIYNDRYAIYNGTIWNYEKENKKMLL